jgi:two-component system, chemotaxis family, chemotaxis protein CheY
VVEAEDGHEAFLKLHADAQIDFIITDLNMPVMNGIEFLRKVKQTPELARKNLPIIMLTTEFAQTLKDQGRENGVKVWLVKPYKPELLLLAMSKFLAVQGNAKAA